MVSSSHISNQVPYFGNKEVIVDDHDTNDIIKWIRKEHPTHAKSYDKISEMHWQGNAYDTARHLFDFCKDNITYRVEHPDDQTIKSPGAILHHGYGDCKHYASYIVGVCDSLRRMGYPVKAHYRFTADLPTDPKTGGEMEVHHVFAVVSDAPGSVSGSIGYPRGSKGNQWGHDKIRDYAWNNGLRLVHGYEVTARRGIDGTDTEIYVDPVLSGFNKKPHYYNIKDVQCMPLSRISGTGSEDYQSVGKFKNIFKDIAHGLQVNAQNINKGIKKAEHGLAVDAANLKKGTQQTLKKAGKLAKDVKNVVLKVGVAPARNAFLALLDLNVFNMAVKLHDTLKAGGAHATGLQNDWKKLGGDVSKLAHAIANGVNWHNKHGRGKAVHGIGNRQVGVVAIAPILALAGTIIAALSQYLHLTEADKKNLGEQTQQGVMQLAQSTSTATDIANGDHGPEAAAALNTITAAPGAASMNVSTGVDENGDPTVMVHDVQHPSLAKAGTPGGGANNDVSAPGEVTDIDPNPAAAGTPGATGAFDIAFGKVSKYVTENPGKVALGTVTVFALGYAFTTKRKRR